MKPKLANELKIILTAVVFTLAALISPCAKAETSGYITQYSVDTANLSSWTASENTTLSANEVKRNDAGVVSFAGTAKSLAFGASYTLKNLPTREFDNSNLTLKLLLYISDANALKGGTISLLGKAASVEETEEAEETVSVTETDNDETEPVNAAVQDEKTVYYEWVVSDLDLKTGWNRLMLNFNTAEGYEYSENFTFDGITELRISLEKQSSSGLTAAVDNTEIAVYSLEAEDVPLTPVTDEFSTGEIIAAILVTAAIFGGIITHCWLKAKKEAERRRKARKARLKSEREEK